mmetsp:Transcript_8316/g.34752  ORF Transcript_8316/g.34752 Transcript_8316/m.34752 type:complete len:360 (+) Transcript_8316:900-1979(+)
MSASISSSVRPSSSLRSSGPQSSSSSSTRSIPAAAAVAAMPEASNAPPRSTPSASSRTRSNKDSSSFRIFRANARIRLACIGPSVSVCATRPSSAPACAAAPRATTSSGSTSPGVGRRPNVFSTNRRTAGVLVAPPTKSTWSKGLPVFRLFLDDFLLRLSACSASRLIPALSAAFSTGRRRSRRISEHTFSSIGRVSVLVEPPGIGTTTSVASLSFSRARLAACSAPRGSTVAPSALASFASHRATARSRSSPPRCASPPVARTSTAPPPTSSTETSNVPPPRSNTKTVSSPVTSTPYASAAAMGSRSSFTVSNPALRPARIVASHWPSSKYAGTVITALVIAAPPSLAEASATHFFTI